MSRSLVAAIVLVAVAGIAAASVSHGHGGKEEYGKALTRDPWAMCANENQNCETAFKKTLVRFGPDGGPFNYVEFTGSGSGSSPYAIASCDVRTFGDPARGKSKSCWQMNYETTLSNPGVYSKPFNDSYTSFWMACSNEGQWCEITCGQGQVDACFMKIRFGNPATGQWVYQSVASRMYCSRNQFGMPTYDGGQLVCQYFHNAKVAWNITTHHLCANFGYNCDMSNEAFSVKWALIAAAGDPSTLGYWRITDATSVMCDWNNWDGGWDGDPSKKKACYYYVVDALSSIDGSWERVTSGSSVQYSVTWGTSRTSGSEHMQQFGTSFTEEVQGGFLFENSKVSYTVSQSVADTVSYASTVSVSATCNVNCGASNGTYYYIFQWQMNSGEVRDPGIPVALTDVNVASCNYLCRTLDESTPPKCPVGFCKFPPYDENCLQCTDEYYAMLAKSRAVTASEKYVEVQLGPRKHEQP